MTEETKTNITLDDVNTLEDIQRIFNETNNQQLEWAKVRIQQTQYPQAVQTELAMHRTDLLAFTINALIKLLIAQQERIAELEGNQPVVVGH